MTRRIVPDLVSGKQVLAIVLPGATVSAAAKQMAERNIGAVIIAEEGHLLGVFSERDLTRRVVALGRDPRTTLVEEVMTSDLATIGPNDEHTRALDLMRRTGSQHLPVMDGERLVGILSIRDLYRALDRDLEAGVGV
jgi:CBS domain-containing protein